MRQIIIIVLSVCALMTFPLRSMILLAIVILLAMTAGCASTPDNGLPTGTTPAGTGDHCPDTTAGNPADLTNQNSPLAAVFRNGASYTTFEPGQPRIGLEKISRRPLIARDDGRSR